MFYTTVMQTKGTPKKAALLALFRRPANPAASCLHLIRHLQPVSRAMLISGSGKSQPTVTRAVSALMSAELVQERNNLVESQGPGRPSIPLELAPTPWIHVGIAIGTATVYIGAYNTRGVAIRETMLTITAAELSPHDYFATVMARVTEVIKATELPAAGIGIATGGRVSPQGVVTAANLGWDHVNIAQVIAEFTNLPLTISEVPLAIAGAEQQAQNPTSPAKVLVLYADHTRGAALSTSESVNRLPVDATVSLERAAATLVMATHPRVLVLAGSNFETPRTARMVAEALRNIGASPEIRIIPTHLDNARSAARAVALDKLMFDPLAVRRQVTMLTNEFII